MRIIKTIAAIVFVIGIIVVSLQVHSLQKKVPAMQSFSVGADY